MVHSSGRRSQRNERKSSLSIIVRDRESKNLSVELLLAPYKSEEFHNSSYRQSYTMAILPVCDIKCCSTALDLARQNGKYICYYKV